jgi:small subunit ribosomal protein S20
MKQIVSPFTRVYPGNAFGFQFWLYCERSRSLARSRQSVKRHNTDIEKRLRNRSKLNRLRTALRRVVETTGTEEKADVMKKAQSLLDKAGQTRLVHPNKARRIQSRMAHKAAAEASKA